MVLGRISEPVGLWIRVSMVLGRISEPVGLCVGTITIPVPVEEVSDSVATPVDEAPDWVGTPPIVVEVSVGKRLDKDGMTINVGEVTTELSPLDGEDTATEVGVAVKSLEVGSEVVVVSTVLAISEVIVASVVLVVSALAWTEVVGDGSSEVELGLSSEVVVVG